MPMTDPDSGRWHGSLQADNTILLKTPSQGPTRRAEGSTGGKVGRPYFYRPPERASAPRRRVLLSRPRARLTASCSEGRNPCKDAINLPSGVKTAYPTLLMTFPSSSSRTNCMIRCRPTHVTVFPLMNPPLFGGVGISPSMIFSFFIVMTILSLIATMVHVRVRSKSGDCQTSSGGKRRP